MYIKKTTPHALIGRTLSEETRIKISNKLKGKKTSKETRKKMSISHGKNTNPSKRPEVREKIRLSKIGKKRKPFTTKAKKNMSLSHIGLKNNWQGGKTSLSQLIRSSIIYCNWRESIFKRDNFVCKDCGKRGGKLHVHHIIPFSKILQTNNIKTQDQAFLCIDLWEMENGVTMCISCHKKTKSYLNNKLLDK